MPVSPITHKLIHAMIKFYPAIRRIAFHVDRIMQFMTPRRLKGPNNQAMSNAVIINDEISAVFPNAYRNKAHPESWNFVLLREGVKNNT